MQAPHLVEAARLYQNLRDPIESAPDGDDNAVFGHMLRMGQAQFVYQMAFSHLLARAAVLYCDVWPTVPQAAGIVPRNDLMSAVGVDLETLLYLTLAATAVSKNGFLLDHRLRETAIHRERRVSVDDECVTRFLAWISASYEQIRTSARKHPPPTADLDPYRFNPLLTHPVVQPDIQPDPTSGIVYLVPSWRLLLRRGTVGLYHEFSELHRRQGADNRFRTAFGYVFQEYVGVLLREGLATARVLAEFRYGNECDSPDWIVLEGDCAVVIEVKQSAQFLESKMWGELSALRSELRKTLGRAFQQLQRFDEALRDQLRGIEHLSGIRRVERLVVTNDETHWNNWVLREAAAGVAGLAKEFHAHVAPIEDFERLIGCCRNTTLFELLDRKRTKSDEQDFMDWLAAEFPGARNAFLDRKHNELSRHFGLPSRVAEEADNSP